MSNEYVHVECSDDLFNTECDLGRVYCHRYKKKATGEIVWGRQYEYGTWVVSKTLSDAMRLTGTLVRAWDLFSHYEPVRGDIG